MPIYQQPIPGLEPTVARQHATRFQLFSFLFY